jgi:hypothetical protein
MTWIEQMGVALGLATLAGVNLYLTVLVAGLAVRFQWIDLAGPYQHLAELGNPWILGVAGVLFLVELVADKIPWLDSAWDAVHTLIRPAGGIFLGLAALGELHPAAVAVATLLTGGAALSTHGTKAGVRAFLNLSPEPVSNSVASVTEDGLVLGGLGLIAFFPMVALFVFIGVVVLSAVAAWWLWRKICGVRKLGGSRSTSVGC